MNQTKCCDTCLLRNMVKPQCGNSVCPCHKSAEKQCTCPPPKPYDWKHLEGCPTTDTFKDYMRNRMDDPALIGEAATAGAKDQDEMLKRATDTSDWRERFDQQFDDAFFVMPLTTQAQLKAFIAKEIETARAAIEDERPIYYPSREAFVEAMEATKAAERARLREVIAGQKITDVGYTQSMSHRGHYERGYNTALTDLLETLKD